MKTEDIKTKDCIGCAYCCMEARCMASMRLYPAAEVCPALQWNELMERHICDLMQLPGSLGDLYRKELYCGAGCCSSLNTWRREPIKNRLEPDNPPPVVLDKYLQIFLNCLGKQFMSMDGVYLAIMQLSQILLKEGVPEGKVTQISQTMMHVLIENRVSRMTDFFGS